MRDKPIKLHTISGVEVEIRRDGPTYVTQAGDRRRFWVAYLPGSDVPVDSIYARWKSRPRSLRHYATAQERIELEAGREPGQAELFALDDCMEIVRDAHATVRRRKRDA